MNAPLYDAHNHLQDDWLEPHLSAVWSDLDDIGLCGAVVNGTKEDDWERVAVLARDRRWIIPSFGLHPWYVSRRSPRWLESLQERLDRAGPRVAVGEIGIDRWIEEFDIDDQTGVFVAQLRLAAERNLPATIHCLQAWGILADTLRREPVPDRGFLIHAYGGPAEMVGPFAKRGAYFSFNGAHLDPRKTARREVFKTIPLERLLVETDAPAMPSPPEYSPFTLPPTTDGKPVNHPANLAATYAALADLRGMTLDALAAQVEQNHRRLFDPEAS